MDDSRCRSWCWIDYDGGQIKSCQKAIAHLEKDHIWLSAVDVTNTRILAVWQKDNDIPDRYYITIGDK